MAFASISDAACVVEKRLKTIDAFSEICPLMWNRKTGTFQAR
jgi:hypothetical protein